MVAINALIIFRRSVLGFHFTSSSTSRNSRLTFSVFNNQQFQLHQHLPSTLSRSPLTGNDDIMIDRMLLQKRLFQLTTSRWMLHATTSTADSGKSNIDNEDATTNPDPMANLYMEWSIEDDKLLWEHRDESIIQLAERLGRGLRGVQARLSKLKDPKSPAYERLFADSKTKKEEPDAHTKKKSKLVPVSEILRRIQWDYQLSSQDFFILHYDRVDDIVVESPMDAPNNSIQSEQTSLVDALPEHRIVAIKYKERIVWDKEKRIDLFYSGDGIENVMETYDQWKQEKDSYETWLKQRQVEVATRLKQILGLERYQIFKTISNDLQSNLEEDISISAKAQAEKYVQAALTLFHQVQADPSHSLESTLIPNNDLEALDLVSELVALSPSSNLRPVVLQEIAHVIQSLEGKGQNNSANKQKSMNNYELPEIKEDDLTETFVRGTGPGGQKINKTNNKVLLVHNPTQIRVECQETRSLQQNRKIARKRLRLKLDEFLNGSQSKISMKAEKASTKKAKVKAKNRARQKKKAQAKKLAKKDKENSNTNVES